MSATDLGSSLESQLQLIDAHRISDPPPNGDGEAEAEETAQLLEHFVEGVPRPNAYRPAVLGPTPSSVAPDFPNPYWSSNDPKRHGEKLALIREIVDAMPTVEIIDALLEVFITRCQGPLGNVVHTPTFLKQAQHISNCLKLASLDSRVLAVSSTVPMEKLGGYLLAVGTGSPIPMASCLHYDVVRSSCLVSRSIRRRLSSGGLLPR